MLKKSIADKPAKKRKENNVETNKRDYDKTLKSLLGGTSSRSSMIHFYPGAGEYAPSKAIAGKI